MSLPEFFVFNNELVSDKLIDVDETAEEIIKWKTVFAAIRN